jgi:hypothetical protein
VWCCVVASGFHKVWCGVLGCVLFEVPLHLNAILLTTTQVAWRHGYKS